MTCVIKCFFFGYYYFVYLLICVILFDSTVRTVGNTILRFCNSIVVGKRELYTRSVHDVLTDVRHKLTRCIRFVVAAALFRERRFVRPTDAVRTKNETVDGTYSAVYEVAYVNGRNKTIISEEHVCSVK